MQADRLHRFTRLFLPVAAATIVALLSVDGQAQSQGLFRLLTFDPGTGPRLGATVGTGEADILDVHNGIRWLIQTGAPEAQGVPYIPADMRALIEAGPGAIAAVRKIHQSLAAKQAAGGVKDPGGHQRIFYPHTGVKIMSPVTNPSKIFGLAGNYPREGDLANPKFPSAFFKSVAALTGQDDIIDLHGLITAGVHEPEMSFVIGKRAKNVPESQALDYVVGYTICNDVSARGLAQGQHPSQGSTISKGIDTFSPCGPYLTLSEDVPDPHNLAIEAKVNGKVWDLPNPNTRHLTFKIPQLIAYLSGRITLLPGDIVQTGVPAPVVTLSVGDTIEITIERLGTLRNRVVANASATN